MQTGKEATLLGGMIFPCFHPIIAGWQLGALRYDAGLDLAGEPLFTLFIPSALEYFIIALDQVERRLMRGVACAE